jgi:hypothetical protein
MIRGVGPRARLAAIAVPLVAIGCASVPSLTFEVADGQADDAPVDDGASSSDAAASCPAAPPPGASVCCGSVACNGNCASQCPTCITECDAGLLCCAHANSVTCRPPGTSCP